jgi:hypothetical protein
MKKILLAMFLLVASFAAAQTVTFTTQGGASYPEHFNVVSEDGVTVSGTVQIAQDYGYPQSGIVLPNNPVAPGEYLNPIIDITAYAIVYGANGATKTETFTFNSNNDPQYGYVWAGTFMVTSNCTHRYRGHCTVYEPQAGSGTMTAAPVQ